MTSRKKTGERTFAGLDGPELGLGVLVDGEVGDHAQDASEDLGDGVGDHLVR